MVKDMLYTLHMGLLGEKQPGLTTWRLTTLCHASRVHTQTQCQPMSCTATSTPVLTMLDTALPFVTAANILIAVCSGHCCASVMTTALARGRPGGGVYCVLCARCAQSLYRTIPKVHSGA